MQGGLLTVSGAILADMVLSTLTGVLKEARSRSNEKSTVETPDRIPGRVATISLSSMTLPSS